MKRSIQTLLVTTTITIGTLAVSAFAAENKLNFHADFPFQVGKMTMPAGNYTVRETTVAGPGITVYNVAAKKGAFLKLPTPSNTPARDERASIDFRCAESACTIVSIANLRSGFRFSAWGAAKKDPNAVLISVKLTPSNEKAE